MQILSFNMQVICEVSLRDSMDLELKCLHRIVLNIT
jgi:hypothetical protein